MKTAWLLAFISLAACNHEKDKFRFSTAQQDEERVAAMYAMRAIGVELVTMFDDKTMKPSRIRELTGHWRNRRTLCRDISSMCQTPSAVRDRPQRR
jgi:hypothetical protein